MRNLIKFFSLITIITVICLSYGSTTTAKPDTITCSAAAVKSYNLPIVMYHSVLKSRCSKYIVTPTQLESDFKAYADMGYTPVFLSEVADFVEGHGKLPQKPMVITFDDGHYNNIHYALPIAKKYNFKIVINVVTSYCTQSTSTDSNPNFSYITLPQLKELTDSGLVEIGNHTHAMHKFKPRYGIGYKHGEDDETYASVLKQDIERAQSLITQYGAPRPITFAYPFGKYTKKGTEVLKELGFRTLLTCNEGISVIRQGDPDSILSLKRYNRSGNTSTTAFIKKVFGKLETNAKEFK